MQNGIKENYSQKYNKAKNKKILNNKFGEKGSKNDKDNKHRRKLALIGLNKPNSTRNQQFYLKISSNNNVDFDIDINKLNNNSNLIKINDINTNTNINKKEANKKNKIRIFHIDKIPKTEKAKEETNVVENLADKEKEKEKEKDKEKDKEKPNYFYPEINDIMRAILIDWIVDIHLKFKLRQETLFMTIWLIDTYLSFAFVQRDRLQLLGITCLLISCKSHEIYYPQQTKLIEATDNAYTKEEMLTMENQILKKLNFYIVCPNPIDFYNILSKMFNFDKKHYYLGNYFIESALVNYQILKYSSSVVASSCAYLVMKYYRLDGYQKLYNNFIINEKYPEDVIKDAAKEIYMLVDNLSKTKFKAVKNKYSSAQFEKVAEMF